MRSRCTSDLLWCNYSRAILVQLVDQMNTIYIQTATTQLKQGFPYCKVNSLVNSTLAEGIVHNVQLLWRSC